MKHQQGVGLLEVLVALLLLAIAVLGFAALQLRAVQASFDAGNNVQAMSVARDLAERMRVNRGGLGTYRNANTVVDVTEYDDSCDTKFCTSTEIATYDINQVRKKASDLGMRVAVHNCPSSNLRRSCIFVAWGDTTPTIGTDDNHCMKSDASYNVQSQCIILEAYNHE